MSASVLFAVLGNSERCYGALQEGVNSALNATSLVPELGMVYVYTKPLEDSSTCRFGGTLIQMHFCYVARLANSTEPVITIALLEDNGFQYVAKYVYTETEDTEFCLRDYDSTSCCKWVSVTPPVEMKSTYALAIVTSPEDVGNGFIYEVGGTATGFVSEANDVMIEEGTGVENLQRSDTESIPQLALQLILEIEVSILFCVFLHLFVSSGLHKELAF